jgi:hypothetical protein
LGWAPAQAPKWPSALRPPNRGACASGSTGPRPRRRPGDDVFRVPHAWGRSASASGAPISPHAGVTWQAIRPPQSQPRRAGGRHGGKTATRRFQPQRSGQPLATAPSNSQRDVSKGFGAVNAASSRGRVCGDHRLEEGDSNQGPRQFTKRSLSFDRCGAEHFGGQRPHKPRGGLGGR